LARAVEVPRRERDPLENRESVGLRGLPLDKITAQRVGTGRYQNARLDSSW
ncbi:MAG: hypothetical protein RL167_664, partial [Actinomycetota bacterium]